MVDKTYRQRKYNGGELKRIEELKREIAALERRILEETPHDNWDIGSGDGSRNRDL